MGRKGMDMNMDTSIMGYKGTTTRIQSLILIYNQMQGLPRMCDDLDITLNPKS